jgi:hypothetical protein
MECSSHTQDRVRQGFRIFAIDARELGTSDTFYIALEVSKYLADSPTGFDRLLVKAHGPYPTIDATLLALPIDEAVAATHSPETIEVQMGHILRKDSPDGGSYV